MLIVNWTRVIIASFVLVFATAYAQQQKADDAQKAAIESMFNELDANHDGAISKAEATKMRGLPERFEAADTNKDSKLDKAEFSKAMGA